MACLQSLSGTGSLRVGAAFIKAWLPGKTVYLSNPTWGNHRNIFGDAGLEWKYYSYFDPASIGLDFAGMKADLEAAPEGSIVVLHGANFASLAPALILLLRAEVIGYCAFRLRTQSHRH